MKIGISCLVLTALASTTNAWSLYAGGEEILRKMNTGVSCQPLSLSKGDHVSFHEAIFESCKIGLYEDSKCKDPLKYFTAERRQYELQKSVYSYKVACD